MNYGPSPSVCLCGLRCKCCLGETNKNVDKSQTPYFYLKMHRCCKTLSADWWGKPYSKESNKSYFQIILIKIEVYNLLRIHFFLFFRVNTQNFSLLVLLKFSYCFSMVRKKEIKVYSSNNTNCSNAQWDVPIRVTHCLLHLQLCRSEQLFAPTHRPGALPAVYVWMRALVVCAALINIGCYLSSISAAAPPRACIII